MRAPRVVQHLSISLILAGFVFAVVPASTQERIFENKDEQKLRREAFWSTHCDPAGLVRPDLWRLGIDQYLTVKSLQPRQIVPPASSWLQIGPQPLRIDNDQILLAELRGVHD